MHAHLSFLSFAQPASPASASFPAFTPVSARPVRRSSRDALTLPAPKPAPSATLPAVPTRPALALSLAPPPTAAHHRATHSAPALLSPPIVATEASYFSFAPSASPSPSIFTPSLRSPSSLCSPSSSSFAPSPASTPSSSSTLKQFVSAPPLLAPRRPSTASHHTRQRNRSAALAALEGRPARLRTFMNMSDGDDDDEELALDLRGHVAADNTTDDGRGSLIDVLAEEEDIVLPAPASLSSLSPPRRPAAPRRRKSTIESFFAPLTNFIDLRDDESSRRSWRSFVEIAS